MENGFIVKIVGIIFDPKERKVLVGKNKGDEKYTFLEGDLDHGEDLDKCLKRTTSEKTGFTIHNLGSIYARNYLKEGKQILELFFLCEAMDGKEELGPDVQEIIWIKPSEIEKTIEEKLPSRLKEYITNLE